MSGELPGFACLITETRAGDTVVVFKLDRLGRSVQHLADLLVRFQKEGIHFCSLSEGINPGRQAHLPIFQRRRRIPARHHR